MYATAFNPSSSPVVASSEGHTIGGGEWGTVDTLDEVTKAALESGALLQVDALEDHNQASGEALTVAEETARRQSRAGELEGRDKAALQKIAKATGLVTDDEDVLRADLERRIVESDVDIPKVRSKPQQSSEEK